MKRAVECDEEMRAMVEEMGELRFYASKGKLARVVLACFLGAAICAWIALLPGRSSAVIGGILAMWCGCAALIYVSQMFRRKPVLILTPERITYSLGISGFSIDWQDVGGLLPYKSGRQTRVGILLADTTEYIARQPALKRLELSLSRNMIPTPLSIPISLLTCPAREAFEQMITFANAHVVGWGKDQATVQQRERTSTYETTEQQQNTANVDNTSAEAVHAPSARWPKAPISFAPAFGISALATVFLLLLVVLVHIRFPQYELLGFTLTLVASCLLMLSTLRFSRELYLLAFLAFGFAIGASGFSIAHGWIEGLSFALVVLGFCFIVASVVSRARLNWFIQKNPIVYFEYLRRKANRER